MSASRLELLRTLAHVVGLLPAAPSAEALAHAVGLGLVVAARRRGELRISPSAWVEELLHDETRAGRAGLGRAVVVAVEEVLAQQPAVAELAHAVAAVDSHSGDPVRPAAIQAALSLRLLAVPSGWRSPLRLTPEAEDCVQAVMPRHLGDRRAAVREVARSTCELQAWNRMQRQGRGPSQ